MGNAIVNIFGFPPVQSKFTPSFKTRHFVLEKTNQLLSQGKYFNEEKVFYNMLDRNKKVNEKNPKKKESNLEPFIHTLNIQVEKFDFESLGLFDLKLEIKDALEERKYIKLIELTARLEEVAKSQNADNYEEARIISAKARQLQRLR